MQIAKQRAVEQALEAARMKEEAEAKARGEDAEKALKAAAAAKVAAEQGLFIIC
jgi:hypothetical protein